MLKTLRDHPDLYESIHEILALVKNAEGQTDTADEVEEKLIELVRELGVRTMKGWGDKRQEHIVDQFKKKNPDARYGKKND